MRRQRYHPVLNALGLIPVMFGLLMGFPLIVSLILDDGATLAYDIGIAITVGTATGRVARGYFSSSMRFITAWNSASALHC